MKKYYLSMGLMLLANLAIAQQAISQSDAERVILKMQTVYEEAVAKKDLSSIMQLYEEDAQYLPFQHVILQGKAQIEKAWQRTFKLDLDKFDLELVSVEAEGGFLFEVGRTHSIFNLPNGKAPGEFKYLNVWRKQADGTYKIFRAMYNQWVAPQ